MKREMNTVMATARRSFVLLAGVLVFATTTQAQTPEAQGSWRIGASAGGYVPLSSLIVSDALDTQLEAGPSFSLEAQYLVRRSVAIYANGTAAFGTIHLGSAIRPAIVGPSNQVVLGTGTAGLLLSGYDLLGERLLPTLRLGGGFKSYSFDLVDADNQLRPTADIGIGLRGIGIGSIDVSAEVRYLLSSFDQAKLPIRGIAPQDQRQNDLVLAIGFSIRP